MADVVTFPPDHGLDANGAKTGGWWRAMDQAGRLLCDLCPRACQLKPGARGFCFVRENRDGRMVLTTYGRSTGFCVDPTWRARPVSSTATSAGCDTVDLREARALLKALR